MNLRPLRICAVLVLYYPGPEVMNNILTWCRQVERIYVVDNSEFPVQQVADCFVTLDNVRYLPQGENLGVARALNIGAIKAAEAGYDLLLTMDQDSNAAPDMVEQMMACLITSDPNESGMISPFHLTKAVKSPNGVKPCQDVMTPMTSGCLLNLRTYQNVGPFRDDFFIDFVDNEYCLRLRREGYRVIRANRALLKHQVGDLRTYGPFVATNHSPLRRYYKTRNRLYVFREYLAIFPGHCLFDLVRLTKEIGSILLFEEQKWAKFRMMLRGAVHFLQGRSGSLEEASR